jgi:cell division septal protein FtsQ
MITEYEKQYRASHRVQLNAYAKQRYQKNLEKMREYNRIKQAEWRKKYPEKVKEINRRQYEKRKNCG